MKFLKGWSAQGVTAFKDNYNQSPGEPKIKTELSKLHDKCITDSNYTVNIQKMGILLEKSQQQMHHDSHTTRGPVSYVLGPVQGPDHSF